MKLSYIFLILLIVLSQSCSTDKKKTETRKNKQNSCKDFKTGEIIKKVICSADTNKNYSLYLPSDYSTNNTYPIIFFFDPHAKGYLPITNYKNIAENYNLILVGSNNSQNGLPWNEIQAIINSLFNDIFHKFSIDKKQVYTAGLSGGARIANHLALSYKGINGVISCAAGFQLNNKASQSKLNFIGIVGNQDFNFIELLNLNNDLSKTNINHNLFIFDGKHAWPPSKTFEEAVISLYLYDIKNGVVPVDNNFIKEKLSYFDSKIKSIKNTQTKIEEYNLYQNIISCFKGLSDVSEYENKILELTQSANFEKLSNEYTNIINEEIKLRDYFTKSFNTKNLPWWRKNIQSINERIELNSNYHKTKMYNRLLNFLSISAFMNSSNAIKSNNNKLAEKYLSIYELVDPKNSDVYYLESQYYAKQGNVKKLFQNLQKAVILGFDDYKKINNDDNFKLIKNSNDFKKILEECKK